MLIPAEAETHEYFWAYVQIESLKPILDVMPTRKQVVEEVSFQMFRMKNKHSRGHTFHKAG